MSRTGSACMHVASAATIPRRSTETSKRSENQNPFVHRRRRRRGVVVVVVAACLLPRLYRHASTAPHARHHAGMSGSLSSVPSLCRIAVLRAGMALNMHRYEMWRLRLMGFPPHVPLVVVGADGGEEGGVAFQLSSRQNGGGGGGGEAGMQSSVVIAALAAGVCCWRRQWGWRLGGWTDWWWWVSIVMMLPGLCLPHSPL